MKRIIIAITSVMAIIVAYAITTTYAHQNSDSSKERGHQMMHQMCKMMMGNMDDMENMGDVDNMMDCPMMRPQMEESFYLDLKEKIGLSDEQVKSLQSIKSAYQRGQIKIDADIRITEAELNELLEKDDLDLSQVEVKIRKIEELRVQQRLDRIKSLKEADKLLTEEQKAKVRSLRDSGCCKGMKV